MLRVENLSFSYGKIQAIRNVSFELDKGEIMAIVGANGAGKSSLMKCIAGLLKPQWGEVYLNDRKMEPAAYKVVEQGVCLVPEGRWIFPNLTVEENLMLGGYTSKNRAAGIERAYGMFPRLEERRKQRAGTMSGGEQQMLAIARGLMANPKVDPQTCGCGQPLPDGYRCHGQNHNRLSPLCQIRGSASPKTAYAAVHRI